MAYGEIYNTTWWGVALDTARTAGTEPDFFGSQMKLLTSEQDSIVTNGDFATDSDWSKGTGWSIANGKASNDGSVSGNSYLINSASASTIGKTYKVVFTVSNYVQGNLRVRAGQASSAYVSANGTYTQYQVSTNTETVRVHAKDNFIGSIDNVSVQVARLDLDQIEAKKCLADWIHTTALQDLNN